MVSGLAVTAIVSAEAAPVTGVGKIGRLARRGGRLVTSGLRRLSGKPAWTDERRSQTVAASTALLLLLAMAALLIGRATAPRPAGPPQVGGGTDDSIEATVPAQPGSRSGIRRLSPNPARSGAAGPGLVPSAVALPPDSVPSVLAADVALVATYKTEKSNLSGYDASITIHNNGKNAAADWTVVLTLPLLGLSVHTVNGAVVVQTGKKFTFTAVDATRTIPPGGVIQFTFQVAGLGHPDACEIDGQPCTGVPG